MLPQYWHTIEVEAIKARKSFHQVFFSTMPALPNLPSGEPYNQTAIQIADVMLINPSWMDSFHLKSTVSHEAAHYFYNLVKAGHSFPAIPKMPEFMLQDIFSEEHFAFTTCIVRLICETKLAIKFFAHLCHSCRHFC